MNKYFAVLRNCALFNNIEDKDLNPMLSYLGTTIRKYKKGMTILSEGDKAENLGIVLSGVAEIIRVDYYGNRNIVATAEASNIFAESFACAGIEFMPLDVVAEVDTEVMFINIKRITQSCNNECSFHNRLIFNLLNIVANKNIIYFQKFEITSKRSTREKLITFLHIQAKKNGSNTFVIPFDRQSLADYLGVERSGLSAEISKMRNEGIFKCDKSKFTLL